MKKSISYVLGTVSGLVGTSPVAASAAPFELSSDFGSGMLSTILYALLGLLVCAIAYKFIDMVTPGHLHKQLGEEKNMAMAIVVGSLMIGVSIIIAASIAG